MSLRLEGQSHVVHEIDLVKRRGIRYSLYRTWRVVPIGDRRPSQTGGSQARSCSIMWKEYRSFGCPACAYVMVESFLKMTGEALHDQWIDIKEYAQRERSITASTCPQCGHQGLEYRGVSDTRPRG